jgi:uncharacterized protein (DUF488 family)
MRHFGDSLAERRAANAAALAAFGIRPGLDPTQPLTRVVHEGGPEELFTIGYERRSPGELATVLAALKIVLVLDVREKPVSRRPGFGSAQLREVCEDTGLSYESWTSLGSTRAQRERLLSTGDMAGFKRRFRAFARRYRQDDLARLCERLRSTRVALLCYERNHDDCHRSVLADLIHERTRASVVAIC